MHDPVQTGSGDRRPRVGATRLQPTAAPGTSPRLQPMRPPPDLPGVRHAEHDLPTGVRLHVAEAGDPGAPPLLAVHGWPQHWWMWRKLIPALAAHRRVLLPDLRGLGWSGIPADG